MKNPTALITKNALYSFFRMAILILSFALLTGAANAGTFTVTTTNDGLSINSLREAINAANQTSDSIFTININIGAGGLKTIMPTSPLPAIEVPDGTTLVIDATTMPGYAGTPLLQLSGGAAGASANGLTIIRGNVVVKGFIINNFAQYGISLQCLNMQSDCSSTGALSVYGSYIGTTADGTSALGNKNGIYLRTHDVFNGSLITPSNIGGTGANQRNIISGNDFNGIVIDSPQSFDDIRIVNNYIGTNAAGNAAIPNGSNGVYILDTTPSSSMPDDIDVLVGGDTAAERNIVSGNGENGVRIDNNYVKPSIYGNYIGTNAAGTADLGNAQNGILLSDSNLGGDTKLGGKGAGEGNVISGNNQNGIKSDSSAIEIYGNRIGTNAAGTAALANTQDGIYLTKGASVGDTLSNGGNTISGNGGDGIHLASSNFQTLIWGNRIGVNVNGTGALPNGGNGITLSAFALVGASGATQYNIISGNTGHGIFISGTATETEIKDNYIGTNASGADLGNGGDGIRPFGLITGVTIGDTTGGGNTIAFNNGDGIYLQPGLGGANPTEFSIRGNSIYSNTALGIDLGPSDGVTANDLSDGDSGPNDLQNFPVLQLASGNLINGMLNSTPNASYEIDFYRVDSCDASGYGEGRYYLGSTSVSTNAGGNVSFNAMGFNLSPGQIIVATANKDVQLIPRITSEFSQCLTVSQPPGDLALSSATYTANENAGTITVTVSRTNGSTGTVSVQYTTSNGTATAGQDYATSSGTLTFTNGQTSKTFTIPITNDTTDEPDETVNIALSNPTGGATLINPSTSVLTITDNDNPPTISINDVSIAEGNENLTAFTFNISLSEASAFPISVNWTTANGTANVTSDYQFANGTVNFAVGETSKQITVQVYGETLVEINEIFNVNLSAPSMATILDGQGVGTILDDDNPGKLSFALAPYNVNENAGFATVTVTRTNGDAGTVTVDYATANGGTATAFSDYTPVADTLIFLDGELQKTFTVPISEDQIVENTESVSLILLNPTGGASVGLSAAVINITDNDNGASLAISGHIKKQDNTPLANVQVALQGTQNLTTTTDANGDYSFTGLTPNGNYTVTPSSFGYIFTPINREYLNLTNSVTNANFTADETPSRMVRVVGSDTVAGQPVSAIVEIVAQGDENSVGFSLSYDAAILSNPQVVLASDSSAASLVVNNTQTAQGRLGVLLSLPAGQVFAAGSKQLVEITFDTAQTQAFSTVLSFNNLPLASEVANVNADPLPSEWIAGTITFAQGYESDVSPRPTGTGNGSVTVADFTQIGRFVAGLNTPDQTNEFQRADTAPRISKGNGTLTVSDYTQAGRYAAGLDPVQAAGGPTQASRVATINSNAEKNASAENVNRVIRVVNASAFPGQQVFVAIEIDARGDENSFGFSVNYDPTKLSAPLVSPGADTQGTTLITNTLQPGKIGVLIGLTPGTSIQSGVRQLVTIRFNVLNVAAGQTPITFNDNPIGREVVDQNVNVLETNYADGTVTIMGTTAAFVTVGGQITDANGRGISKATVTITNMSGQTQTVLTNPFGYYQFTNVEVGEMYILTVSAKRYRFNPNTRMLTVMEESNLINFVADN